MSHARIHGTKLSARNVTRPHNRQVSWQVGNPGQKRTEPLYTEQNASVTFSPVYENCDYKKTIVLRPKKNWHSYKNYYCQLLKFQKLKYEHYY